MPIHVVGGLDSNGPLSSRAVVETIKKLNANIGEVEVVEHLKSNERPSREAVNAGSSLRVLIAIRQANGVGTAGA